MKWLCGSGSGTEFGTRPCQEAQIVKVAQDVTDQTGIQLVIGR